MDLQDIKNAIRQIDIRNVIRQTDKIFLAVCLALSTFGIIMVSSATFSGESFFSRDAKVMILATCMGLIAAMVISFIDYDIILKLWPLVGVVCVAAMLGLFAFGVSPEGRSDAFSWYKIGSLYFQPSEIVKIGFIITFAFHLSNVKNDISSLKNVFFLCVHLSSIIGMIPQTNP